MADSFNKMLKITNVVRRFTFKEWGGTETVVWNTSKFLKKFSTVCSIVCTTALDKEKIEKKEDITIKRFSYFYPFFPMNKQSKLNFDKKGGNPFSFSILFYLLKNKFDILHCHTMGHLGNLVYFVSKLKKVPYIVSLHGGFMDVPKTEIDSIMEPVNKSFHYGKLVNALIGRNRFMDKADGVICVGYNEYQELTAKYKDKNIIYLPNGVDLEAFNKKNYNKTAFRKKNNIPEDAKILLCVSRVDQQKNQLRLVEALNNISNNNLYLFIVGPHTSAKYYQKIQDKVKEFKLSDRVRTVDNLQPYSKELIELYKCSDIFILPSIHEPFGIVILEAWAAKLPVIASNVGGIKRLVTNNKDGLLFEHKDEGKLEELIKTVLGNHDLAEKLIEESYRNVEMNYTWEKIAEKLHMYYLDVIDKYNKK